MAQTEIPVIEPRIIEEPLPIELPSVHQLSTTDILETPSIQEMYHLELPQPSDSDSEEQRDWSCTALFRFIYDDQLKFLLETQQTTQIVEEVVRP